MINKIIVHTIDGEFLTFTGERLTAYTDSNFISLWTTVIGGYKNKNLADINNNYWTWIEYDDE